MNAAPLVDTHSAPVIVSNEVELWEHRERRLRSLDVQLASLPDTLLSASDQEERQRMHAWIVVQRDLLVDLTEAVRLRGLMVHPATTLASEERLLLRETDRFIDQAEAVLTESRTRMQK